MTSSFSFGIADLALERGTRPKAQPSQIPHPNRNSRTSNEMGILRVHGGNTDIIIDTFTSSISGFDRYQRPDYKSNSCV